MNRWIVLPAIAFLLLGEGCRQRERPPTSTAVLAQDDSQPRAGGTLYRRLQSDVASLNPILTLSRYDRMVVQYLFTPLIQFDENLKPIEGLASAWDISPDGRSYTFHLNSRATFSDGKPVRASDVVFTLSKIVDPSAEAVQIASGFEQLDMSQTKAIDDKTVVIAFREALASQFTQFNNLLVLPEHVYAKGDFRKDFNDTAVGSGPYKLVRRVPSSEIVMQVRDDYWGTKPFIASVVFKVILNDATAWNAVKRGDIDETAIPSDVWMREQNDTSLKRKLDFLRYYGLAYNYIAWNSRKPLLADKRMRRALAMCLDIRSIIAGLYGGSARAVNGHFTPDQWAYNDSVPIIEYDIDGAKKALTSLGWFDRDGDGILDRGGKPLRFELIIMSGSAQGQSVAQLYQASLKQAGVAVDIAVLDFTSAFQRILAGNYDASYLSWDLEPDPDPYSLFHSSQNPPRGQNFVFYASRDADRLIEQGRRELDQSKRQAIYYQLHALLAADQPYSWVTQPSEKWVVNRRVKGVKMGKGLGLFLWYPGETAWWLSDAPR